MSVLSVFLAASAGRPLEWGRFDCCLFVADWIALQRGADPVPDLRGRYATEWGAAREIRRAGGLEGLFASRMDALGIDAIDADQAREGDVAVVEVPGRPDILVGAIRTSAGWAAKTTMGLAIAPFRPVRAWSLALG